MEKANSGAEPSDKNTNASRSSRTTALLRAIMKKATFKKEGEKSETPTQFKERVIGLVRYDSSNWLKSYI